MYYFYILKSQKTNAYYLGSTSDIPNRLKIDNRGKVRSTKSFMPWDLVYKEEYRSLRQANKREYQVKSWKSRKVIERLINKAPSSSLV